MSNQYPPPGGGYPPPGGGYPPPGGGYPPPGGKTKTLGLDNNVAAMLCYLPGCLCCVNLIFSILWIATEPKENKFVRFHALQGLLLIGVEIAVGIVVGIIRAALGLGLYATGGGGEMASAGGALLGLLITLIFWAAVLAVGIVGCIKAYQNQWWKLPVIGDIAEKNA